MNKELIEALIANLTSTTFLLKKMLETQEAEQPAKTSFETIKRKYTPIVDPEIILEFIEKKYKKNIIEKCREPEIVGIRMIAAYLMKIYSKLNLKSTGRLLGGRDHTTVINMLKNVKENMDNNEGYVEMLVKVEQELIEYFNNKNAA